MIRDGEGALHVFDPAVSRMQNVWLVVTGVFASLLLSIFVNALLLYVPALTSFGRSMVSAVILPVCISLPLLTAYAGLRKRLSDRQRELDRAASHDRLTDFYAPGAFSQVVDRRAAVLPSDNPSGAFLIVHADGLHIINKRHGLEAGDDALTLIAVAIRSSVRATDIVGRIGATMFGLFLPGAGEAEATDVAERISANVRDVYFGPAGSADAISVRVAGVVFADQLGFTDMFRQAEERLFPDEEVGLPAMNIARIALRVDGPMRH
jgi:diguanylate cyclase